MKVPGGDSIFDRMAEGAQGGPAAATSFTPPVADVSGDAAGVEERLKSSFTHMAGQNERFLDVPELDRQVRDVRALEELGKLSTEERKRTASDNPRAKADQDAFDIVDKVNAGNADFYIDQAAGSPSIMDGYTPPPNTRPMDADKAQALATSTLQRFGLLDQAGVDAAKARQEAEAQATLGLPPELIGDNPSQAMRQAKEMGGAVEAYARMYPVTAGFLHDFPSLVRDDWENLNWLEKLGRQFNNGTMRGQAQVKLSQVMEDVRLNGITPERIAQARLFEQDMKNAAGMPMDTWGQKIVGNAAEQLPQFAYGMPEAAKNSAAFMGMAITGALATGGATTPMVLPMAAVGAKVGYAEFTRQMEGGLAFWELLNMKDAAGNHLDMTGIRVGSEIVGGINAALELAELQMLTKTMPWARRALSEVGREAALKTLLNPTFRQAMFRGFGEFAKFEAKEIGQEVLQELTQVASEEVNKAYARRFGANFAPTTSAELQDRLLDIAEKTAYGMVAFGGPGIAIRTVREASQTAQGKQFLDTFMERIRGDKLAKEAPSAFESLMSANVQAGVLPEKVYMAPDKVLALFQDKDSGQLDVDGLRDFLERAGVDRQVFLDRIGNQADVSFDTARLGRILSTDAGQMLHSQGELTFSPRERAVAQAQAEVERAQATGDPEAIATAESALRETETSISDADRETLDTLFQTAVSRGREFRERIVADMVAAGSTKTEAKANAALIDASAHVWSSETGQPVEEYYRLFGYRFRKTNFGNVLANIYKRDYAGVFKSERDFFQRFDRNEGFRQEVLARVNLGEAGNVQGGVPQTVQNENAPGGQWENSAAGKRFVSHSEEERLSILSQQKSKVSELEKGIRPYEDGTYKDLSEDEAAWLEEQRTLLESLRVNLAGMEAVQAAAPAPAQAAPQTAPQAVAPAGATMKAPAVTPAATVPTASSSPQPAAGAPAADALVAPGPAFEVVRAPARTPGGEGTILTPGGDAVPFRYAVMERADVHASHLPTQGFAKNPEYAHTNERDYRTNRAFQERVMERAMPGKFQPEFLVGHSVDAINGAPIVDDTGSVLGGNSRKMILDLAFEKQPESAARYVDALRAALPALGLDPAAVDGMREPVLVRSLSRLYDAPNTAKLVSAFNQDFKAAMDSRREGISNAKFITPDTAKTLAAGLDGFDTIRSYLDDKASLSFVEKMFRDGALPDSLRSRIVSEDGTLNTEGKDLVVNALRGAVVDDYELMGRVKDGTMKKVDRVIPHMLRIMSREDQFNIQPSFKAAVALLTSWQNGKETETFKAYMNQAGLFTDQADPRRDPVIARLAMALAYNKELELARQFSAYADAAALNQPGRMALPGTVPTFEVALAKIGVAKTSGKAGGQKMFFQDKRPEYQNTEQGGELAGVVYTADGFFAVQRKSWAWGTPYALPIEQELTSFPDSRGMKPEQLLTSSQNALRVQAMAQQGDFVRHLQDLAGMTGGTEVLARVKSSESLTRKVEGELQGDLLQARDVLAGTITYPSLEAAAKAAKFLLDSRPASEVVYFSNRYSNPTPGGFRDFYFILRMPNGFMAELQVNTKDMVAAKEGLGHTLYEVQRLMDSAGVPDGSMARTALDQASQAFYAAAVSPDAAQGLSRALEDLDNNMPELRRAAEAIVPQPILDNVVGYIASAVVNGRDALLNYRVFDQAQPVNTTGQRGPLLQRAPGRPVDILFQDAGAKSLDLGKLTLVERTENGATFRTGQPVTFDFVHNTKSATALYGKPDKDAPFGRGLEPSGRYVNATRDASKAPDNLESGTLTLKNPLVLDNAGLAWKQELSDAYGGLTGKSLSLALLADGYDGVVTVDSPGGRLEHVSEILDLTTFDEAKALYQDRRRGDLAAVHNLSEGNLVYADKLGGLAMPSVGVTKAETPFQGFGEISLVGTPDLVDPKNTPVFDADAYTKRFPEIMHPKVPMKVGQAFFKQHMDTFKETDELNKLQSEIWDDMVNKPNAKRALEVFSFSKAAMLMFLREQGKSVAIPRERVVTALNFMDAQGLAELRENLAQDTEPDRAGVGGIIAAAARRYAEQVYGEDTEKVAKLEQSVLSGFGLQDGVVGLQGYDKVRHALREEGKTVVAGEALRRELQAQVNQEDFAAWAEQRVMSVYGPPFIKLRGKNAPVTLDNLVEAMRGQKVNAQEKGITFSPGAARAAAAQKLTNAGQYDKLRDDITSPEKRKASVAAAEDTLEAYRMAAVKAFTLKNWRGETDYWSGFDASMKALAASGGDPKRLQAMLQRNDFQAVGQDVLDKGVAAYKAMMSVPVEYLEAKPQRAVLLSEFVGAAVPVNTSQRVLDILERNGIRRVEFYAKPEERGAAITRIAKGQDVLFEDNGPHLPQGVTVFGPESTQAVVHFFEAKDLSTSPHEIWHIFRRVLENMATREGASLKVRQDWALACDFVGAQVGETWTREQEEKWADAGLTYLMEGKAPSANLRGVFGRMKDWLLSLYRTFRNMVGINPEMRGVFDRLLATEDELKAAQADLHAVPLFTEGRAFDYDEATRELRQATEDEIMAYRVGKLAAMRKLWAQEGKAQADKMEHQVLIDALAREGGVRLDGEEVDTKTLQEIRKHRPGKLLVGPEGKLSLAEAADMVGKPTEQFLGWLASAKKKSALVREFVAEQEKAFGDDFDASEAMMSERLEKVLELESKYLAQAVNGATYVSPKALKSWVREKTGQTKADQALVGEFDALKAALRREATAAERAFRAGKAGEALAAKERQRAVLAELRARLADQKQAATIQARAVRMADAALKGDSKVDWEFGEQLVRLVVHFGLEGKRKSIFPRQPERMSSLLQFIQAKDADGWTQHSGLIPEWLFAEGQGQLGRSHPNHWKNLTVEQLRDVDKALRYLYDAGRKERQYLMDSREIELVTVADKLIHRMDGLKQVQALADYKREGMVGGMTDNMRRAMAEITNMEYLWDQVDGWESAGRKGTRSGPAWEFIRLPLFEARTAELKEFGRVSQELEDILQPLRGMKNRERFELAGVPLLQEVREEWGGLWNHERVLAAALNMGNAGNLGAMKAGFGWQDEHLSIIAKQLTADEWRMVQRLWDLIDSLRPLLDAAYYALHGQHMPLVEPKALQVETKDGQVLNLKGGYYPLIGDHRLNDKAGHFAEQDLMKNETMALFAPAKVKDSFTLKRTGMALPPRLSLSVLTRHVQQTVHYATHAVAIRNIQRIINLPEFTAQFKAKFGEHNYRMLTPWLKNIARPDIPEMGFWEGILEKWRTLGTISALGMNLQVAMLQLSSIPQSAQDIGWNWLLRGYSAMANPARTVEMVKLVRELSPLMRDRLQDMDRDVNRNLAKYGPTNRKLQFQVGDQHVEVGMEEFQRWVVFGPISFSDACVAYPTWLGAFMKFQSQGKDEKTAARMADDVVLRAQSSGNPMSLSALQHGAGWRRLITMFASFTMNYQNRLRHYVRGLREGKVSGVDYARHLFNETLLPVVLTSIMLKLLKDNELPEPKDLAWDGFGYLLSGFPIARGIPRMLEFGYGGVMDSPAFKGVDLTAKAGKDLIKAFTDGGNAKEHLLAFIKDATDLAGFATGVPTLPVYRFAKGVHDLASGEETNPFRPFFSPSPDKAKH